MIYLDKKIDIEICLIYILNIAYKYILQEKKKRKKEKNYLHKKISACFEFCQGFIFQKVITI